MLLRVGNFFKFFWNCFGISAEIFHTSLENVIEQKFSLVAFVKFPNYASFYIQHYFRTVLTDIGISLSGPIKLSNLRNIKPIDKFGPNLGPEPVTEDRPHFVLAVGLFRRNRQNIPAHLPNVLRYLKHRTYDLESPGTFIGAVGFTVHLYLMQSTKKAEAENFLRMTRVLP